MKSTVHFSIQQRYSEQIASNAKGNAKMNSQQRFILQLLPDLFLIPSSISQLCYSVRHQFKPLEERKNIMSEAILDSITLLMIRRRLIGLSLQESIFAPFLCRAVMFADFQAEGR